jgi:RNA polymerase sigma-70 factor (ECF subfamily)
MTTLARQFLALVAPEAGKALAAWPALDATLRQHLDATCTKWPSLRVMPDQLLAALARRVPREGDSVTWLTDVHAADAFLADACASQDPSALAVFEHRFIPEIAGYLARTRAAPDVVDEVRQVIRERLLVAAEAGVPPRIGSYSGRGPLGAWLRMTTVRTLLNLRRGGHGRIDSDELVEGAATSSDPELDYLKARYRPVFRAALEASLRELSTERRNVLRLYFVDGLTLAEIGRLYRVHETTIVRQLAKIRRDVLAATRRMLIERHGLKAAEVDSVIGLARSRLDLTMSRVLTPSKS